ncbi:hypothetical protein OPV22_010437 [Ensete ventricosum]|uniref:Malectin-like domain-containing protein n=1 Tax=Ensete ventricosum TaxID=4639 RepID=A0AAV8PUG1_ENSVE|nr:hypothetical protein OPV22_010437 [Ensete ventricosum]
MSSSSLLLLLSFLHVVLLYLPSIVVADVESPASPSNGTTIYDLLPQYGLPPGIFPDTAKSFSVASNGRFVVDLYRPCYVDFEYLVYYASRVSGVLRYGAIDNLEGVQGESLSTRPRQGGRSLRAREHFCTSTMTMKQCENEKPARRHREFVRVFTDRMVEL